MEPRQNFLDDKEFNTREEVADAVSEYFRLKNAGLHANEIDELPMKWQTVPTVVNLFGNAF